MSTTPAQQPEHPTLRNAFRKAVTVGGLMTGGYALGGLMSGNMAGIATVAFMSTAAAFFVALDYEKEKAKAKKAPQIDRTPSEGPGW